MTKRLMNSTFITWTKVCVHHGIPRDDWLLDNVIRFTNGSTIDLTDVAYKPTDGRSYEVADVHWTIDQDFPTGNLEIKVLLEEAPPRKF